MAWIGKTEAGTWKAGWRDPNKRVRTKTFPRKEDARRFLAMIEADKARGTYSDPSLGKITLEQFWPRFIAASPHLRPATLALYASVGRRYVLRNPARGVKTPKSKKEQPRFLTAQELDAVVEAAPERERGLVLLLGLCGLRIGEAAALRVDDLDLLHRTVRVTKAISEVAGRLIEGPTKSGTNRGVALPRVVVQALERHLVAFPPGPDQFLFQGPKGGPIRRTNWRRRVWIPALRRAGIAEPLPRPHDLRHTAASLAIQAGAHPKAIQAMLGHSSITVTLDRYGHLFPSLSETLAEAVDAGFRLAQAERVATFLQPAIHLAVEGGAPQGGENGS